MTTVNDAIFFYDNDTVIKSMLLSEFDALLDGFVEVPEFSNQSINCIYAQIDETLNIIGLVCFIVAFNRQGFIQKEWDMRLDQLLQNAKPSIDFGFGSVKTLSQSTAKLIDKSHPLWTPSLLSLQNLISAVQLNKLGLEVTAPVSLKVLATEPDNDKSIEIPTLHLPTIQDSETVDNTTPDTQESYAMLAMYGVKIEKMKQDYEKLKQHSEKQVDTIKRQAQEQMKVLCEDYEQEIKKSNLLVQSVERRLVIEKDNSLKLKEQYVDEIANYQLKITGLEQTLEGLQNKETEVSNEMKIKNDVLTTEVNRLKDCLSVLQLELCYRDEKIAILESKAE